MPNNQPDTIPFGTQPITQSATTIPFGAPPIAAPQNNNPSLIDQVGEGLATIANNIEQPFISVAATPVQLAAKALGKPDPYANSAFPGLGGKGIPVAPITPAGFLQKAGQVGQIGTLVASGGITGIAANAGLGALAGLSQTVANGPTDPATVLKNTIYGGLFGMALGLGGKFLSYMGSQEVARTGVEGAIKDAISNTDPDLLSKYINASMNHGESMESLNEPTAIGLAEDEFDKRASILTEKVIPQAGQAVGDAKDAAGNLPVAMAVPSGVKVEGVDAVNNVEDSINDVMQKLTGHQFTSYGEGSVTEGGPFTIENYPQGPSTQGLGVGEEGGVEQIPGRSVSLSSSEQKQLERLSQQLQVLKDNPNVQTASDVLINLDNDIGKWDNPQFGQGNSPVQGVLKFARGAINRIISPSSPDLAEANATYSTLMDLKDDIASQAGSEGQSSALMMRRVLSGDKSNSVIPVLNQLDAVTAPFREGDDTSLVQHSILANWSTNLFGDETTKQLLAKAVTEGNRLSGEGSSIFGYPKQFMNYVVRGALSALSPDPADYAISIANGEPYSLDPLVRFLDNTMDKTTSLPLIGAFTQQLKDWGVSATAAEPAAKTLLKMFLMQQLTRVNGYNVPQGAPSTLPVNSTMSYGTPPPNTPALSSSNAQQTASAVKTLTPATTGQAMSRRLGANTTPGNISMASNLSLSQ